MSIDDWKDLMPDTVTHKAFSSRGDYGKPTYGVGTDYSARVTYKPKMVKSSDGRDVLARGKVWLAGTPAITPEDQIELPDGSTPPILSVERYTDEGGSHHVVVNFG